MGFRTLWVLAGLIFVGVSGIAHAQSAGVVCAYETNLGVFPYDGRSESVFVEGDYAYIARHQLGLLIVDIRNPLNPTLSGSVSLDIGDAFFDIKVVQSIAYVAAGRRGMLIYDVSDPKLPVLLSTYQPAGGGSVLSLELQSGIAYLACDEQALEIVDVQSPESPVFVSGFGYRGAVRSLALSGNTLCLCVGGLGVELVDVSDPYRPRLLSTDLEGYRGALRAAFGGDWLFVADGHNGFRILDVSNPLQPSLLSMVDPGFAGDVEIIGSRAYVAASDRLIIYDLSNPSEPVEIGVNELHRGVGRVCVRDGLGYLAGGAGDGMRIVDVSDPMPSAFISNLGGSGDLWRVSAMSIEGTIAFFASSTGEMRAVDLGDPKSPDVLSKWRTRIVTGDSVRDHVLRDGVLYMATSQVGLSIVDVSDPTIPTILGHCDIGTNFYGVEIAGSTVFLCNIDTGLWAIDVSSPHEPIVVDRYAENTTIFAATAYGDYLLVPEFDSSKLSVLDISHPDDLRRIGEVSLPSVAGKVVVYDGYAYMPAGIDQGIHIIQITDPKNPIFVGTIADGDRVHELVVRGNRMYAADSYEGLRVFNLTDPVRPRQIGVYGGNWSVEYVGLIHEYAILSDGDGIEIINISENCNVYCLPDTNNDGTLTPADFSAWVAAFNNNAPACDQNSDVSCTPADFSAWVANYNAGCE